MDPHDTFPQRVWHIVASIPEGYVATYGDVARLAGSPRAARQVGGVLKRLPEGSTLPWHRVVNRHGDISLTGPIFSDSARRCWPKGFRSPAAAISISSIIAGFTEDKKKPPSGARRAYCATGTAVCVTGTSVRSACVPPWFITVCTVSVMNISWPFTRDRGTQQNTGVRLNVCRIVRQGKVKWRLFAFGTHRFLRQHAGWRICQRSIRQGHRQYRIRRLKRFSGGY
ncbi:putative methyltransferase [Klebsiella aerogenes]|nr:putative methyltransferase [Klebsiella aerogenes]